ncbi:hypothetical protein [Deinococcus koreensis]|uniref:hypothetical protein n=1 Tax=Deinococcus koreensis TaxID=2054903 RepID=UPI0010573716|nr:hypothetical protein [Deinococcus koreensis]
MSTMLSKVAAATLLPEYSRWAFGGVEGFKETNSGGLLHIRIAQETPVERRLSAPLLYETKADLLILHTQEVTFH